MNKIKLALLSSAVMFAGVVSAQTLDEVVTKFNDGAKLLQEKKIAESIPLFESVVTMGDALGADAMETVENAKKYLPTLYLSKGGMNAASKKYDEAIVDLKKAEELADLYGAPSIKAKAALTLSQVYLMMGGDAYNAKNYAKAVDVFSKGYASSPSNTQLALYLAESYDKLDSLDKAVDVYTGIMNLSHSRHAEAVAKAKVELTNSLLVRASAASAANNLEEVVKFTDKILIYDSINNIATLMRVQTANNIKKYSSVVEFAPAAIAAQSEAATKSEVYYLLASAYENLGNKAKAVESFKNVISGKFVETAKKQIVELSKE